MQLALTFSTPSSNQRMRALSLKSTSLIRVGNLIQSRRCACSRQNPSGSSIERRYIAWYLASSQCDAFATASGTGKISAWDVAFPGAGTDLGVGHGLLR